MYDTRGEEGPSLKIYPNYNGDIHDNTTGFDTRVFSFALKDKGQGSCLSLSACHIWCDEKL
jgi:hypothetical protein